MSGRNVDFGDRLATAAAAKQALLDKAKAKANDPELLKKQAERAAVSAASHGKSLNAWFADAVAQASA